LVPLGRLHTDGSHLKREARSLGVFLCPLFSLRGNGLGSSKCKCWERGNEEGERPADFVLCHQGKLPVRLMTCHIVAGGPGSVVGIATGYRLDGPGIETRWGARFSAPDRPWGPPSLLYNGYRVFPGVKSGRGVTLTPSSAVGQERVELYLYSPYGPYGLYRASVPVQGCTLPLPLHHRGILGRLWRPCYQILKVGAAWR
jgi:hypothetical protein